MGAKNISGQAPGGKREKLSDVLPLDTPFVIQIFPVYACNFKCNYCIFSTEKSRRGFISDKVVMDFDLFKNCIDQMARFPDKIKVLRFVGIGEPLLHSKIVEMVEYASRSGVADVIEILTNGLLLEPEMSTSLIAAGLNRLVVSIQGTSGAKYRDICAKEIDFDKFIENLKFFHDNKGSSTVYIKIVDTALDDDEDQDRFYGIYGDLCDTIAVEHTVPIHHGIDYSRILESGDDEVTQFGLPVSEVNICPQAFFTMQINPDGKVVPCYSFEYPEIVGDCNTQAVDKIWTCNAFQSFRLKMLEGSKQTCEVCRECSIIKYRLFPEDDLNDHAPRLKQIYGADRIG